jgi:hypothetical protein
MENIKKNKLNLSCENLLWTWTYYIFWFSFVSLRVVFVFLPVKFQTPRNVDDTQDMILWDTIKNVIIYDKRG